MGQRCVHYTERDNGTRVLYTLPASEIVFTMHIDPLPGLLWCEGAFQYLKFAHVRRAVELRRSLLLWIFKSKLYILGFLVYVEEIEIPHAYFGLWEVENPR